MIAKFLRLIPVFALLASASAARAAAEEWSSEDVRRVVREWLDASGRTSVSDDAIGAIDDRLRIPACGETPAVVPRSARSTSYTVRCSGPTPWDYTVRIDVDAKRTTPLSVTGPSRKPSGTEEWRVVVVKANLAAGATLGPDVLEERPVDAAPGATAIRSIKEATGLRLLAAVAPGAVLTTRNVARAPHLMKGEPVTIVSGGSGFEVSMPGRAEADGYEGTLVSVKNLRSGTVLVGRLGPGGIVAVR